MMNLSKLCYCQSIKHARAAVKALQAAGYKAIAGKDGYVYTDRVCTAAADIVCAAIKAVRS